ncbi:MAG: hypothetical protein H7X94_02980, partial [Vallitaleaceae bacterium]|nr:hypothetical protein [Vallitaleaceae bacterium]
MKTILMFVGILVLLIVLSRWLVHIIAAGIVKSQQMKMSKYTYQMGNKLREQKVDSYYDSLNPYDLVDVYRKLLKEDGQKKDLKKAAEIG